MYMSMSTTGEHAHRIGHHMMQTMNSIDWKQYYFIVQSLRDAAGDFWHMFLFFFSAFCVWCCVSEPTFIGWNRIAKLTILYSVYCIVLYSVYVYICLFESVRTVMHSVKSLERKYCSKFQWRKKMCSSNKWKKIEHKDAYFTWMQTSSL